ncbi:hypothetical protein FDB40_12850 [Clostridium botulinum]|nr:hypothetical protein [Clostridium botulinum]
MEFNSIILKGSKIGDGSVLDKGSIIAKKFTNIMIAGNSAKTIRSLL